MDGARHAASHPDHAGEHAGGCACRSAPERRGLFRATRASERRQMAGDEAANQILQKPRLDPPRSAAHRSGHGRSPGRQITTGKHPMSDTLIPVPTEGRERALNDRAKYEEM